MKVQDESAAASRPSPSGRDQARLRGGNPPSPYAVPFMAWLLRRRIIVLLIVHAAAGYACVSLVNEPLVPPGENLAAWFAIAVSITAFWVINHGYWRSNRTWLSIQRRSRRTW